MSDLAPQTLRRAGLVKAPRSQLAGCDWPAVMGGVPGRLLGLLQQLGESEWWPPDLLEQQQRRQLGALAAHAYRAVPFWRMRLDQAGYGPGQEITPDLWRRIPPLTRRDFAEAGPALASPELPPGHGKRSEEASSGSTGMPVRIVKSELAHLVWQAITLREELWQKRDLTRTLAVIRTGFQKIAPPPKGARLADWGVPVASVYPTGQLALLHIAAPTAEQVAWLVEIAPTYLLTVPSNLRAITQYCRDHKIALSSLRGLRTVGEVVDPDLRAECRQTWGLPIADMYSAVEPGYMALQCPGHEHYHVQSEAVLLEILNDAGAPCRPGELGRVVVTPLHNFAMPLLRYELGDLAVPGLPCPCGRGLPVIERVVGRVRDLLVLPSGERRYPTGLYSRLGKIEGLVQYQLVQKSLDRLEFRLVVRPPFATADERKLRETLATQLGAHFAVTFVYFDAIPRSPSGKFFEFMSEVAQ